MNLKRRKFGPTPACASVSKNWQQFKLRYVFIVQASIKCASMLSELLFDVNVCMRCLCSSQPPSHASSSASFNFIYRQLAQTNNLEEICLERLFVIVVHYIFGWCRRDAVVYCVHGAQDLSVLIKQPIDDLLEIKYAHICCGACLKRLCDFRQLLNWAPNRHTLLDCGRHMQVSRLSNSNLIKSYSWKHSQSARTFTTHSITLVILPFAWSPIGKLGNKIRHSNLFWFSLVNPHFSVW